jgi:hypothetical protein
MLDREIFTRRQALASGVTSNGLTDLVRAGAISRIGHGVYRMGSGGPCPDPCGLSRSMRAAISHDSAAAWLGADLVSAPSRLHLTAPRDRGRRADCVAGVRLHRAAVPDRDVIMVNDAFVTSPVRTLLDVARALPLHEAVAIGDSLCRKGLVTRAACEQATQGLAGPGRRGAVAVARLIDGRAESVFESISRVTIVTAGLPEPLSQFNILRPDGRWVARVDFAWLAARVALECDGFEFHASREAFERDRRRWNALTGLGWRVIVVTWRDVIDDPAYLVDVLGDIIGRAA